MLERYVTLVEYNGLELHPVADKKHNWLLSVHETCEAFGIDRASIDALRQSHAETLSEGRHFLYTTISSGGVSTSKIMFWTKKGIIRLAYYLKTDAALAFLDFAEDLKFTFDKEEDPQIAHFYDEVEETLLQKLELLKGDSASSLEELNKLIYTVNNLAEKKAALKEGGKKETSPLEGILSAVSKMVNIDKNGMQNSTGSFIEKAVKSQLESDEKTKEKLAKMPKLDF